MRLAQDSKQQCAALRCVSFRSGVMRVKPPYKKQIQIKYVRQTPGVGIKQQISTGAPEFRIRKVAEAKAKDPARSAFLYVYRSLSRG